MAFKIIKIHSVSPSTAASSAAAPPQTLPLLYFDILWLQVRPTETLHFYSLRCSERCFLETIAVKLKHSLSAALKYFLPLASKIIFPLTAAAMPVSRYTAGDSVSLTIATSDAVLADFTANHSKDGEHFDRNFLPFYGRDCVQDVSELNANIWELVKTSRPTVSLTTISSPSNKLRASFILRDAEIKKLKSCLGTGRRVASTFMVVCAHLWSSLAKAAAAVGEEVDDEEAEYFTSPVECRGRLNPVLPDNYFGNCLAFLRAISTHGRLKGEEGFGVALEAIAAAVDSAVVGSEGGGVLDGLEEQLRSYPELSGKRVTPVGGLLRSDAHGADYGWGRAIKFASIHTDFDGAASLFKARDGGVEIGLSLPNAKMDAFAAVFKKDLYIKSSL